MKVLLFELVDLAHSFAMNCTEAMLKKTAHFIYSFLLSMCYFTTIDAESDFNMLVGRSPEDITYVEQNTVAIPLLPLHL